MWDLQISEKCDRKFPTETRHHIPLKTFFSLQWFHITRCLFLFNISRIFSHTRNLFWSKVSMKNPSLSFSIFFIQFVCVLLRHDLSYQSFLFTFSLLVFFLLLLLCLPLCAVLCCQRTNKNLFCSIFCVCFIYKLRTGNDLSTDLT